VADCTGAEKTSCGNGYYEKHGNYDLGFVEYTERGNDFFPERTRALLNRIKAFGKGNGVAVIVFVHGWKHNASPDDENVRSFNQALDTIAKLDIVAGKKIVGVYVGWRGLSLHGLQLENLTYWDRKQTAEQVGRAGVTELLLNLEQLDRQNPDNIMLTIGHSFGGAVVLSALSAVLLERMVAAEDGIGVQSFGNGVVLLNPAIEANQGLRLKEQSIRVGLKHVNIPSLLYVVSSRGDSATTWPFRMGQNLGTNMRWSQFDLQRRYSDMNFVLKESQLDNTTIGNYAPFWTGSIDDFGPAAPSAASIVGLGKNGKWQYHSYCKDDSDGPQGIQLPCYSYEPVEVFRVPASFMENHNDVFNHNVISLISTITTKSFYDGLGGKGINPAIDAFCFARGRFNFDGCFNHYFNKSADGAP